MIKKSPQALKYGASDCDVHEFDPQLDFSQFLEEARQYARRKLDPPHPFTNSEQSPQPISAEVQKKKKSWKNSLFSWWKMQKKSKPNSNPENAYNHISKPKKGHVSGPVYGTGIGIRDITSHQRQVSGPVAKFFTPNKKHENDIPYMCLDQVNNDDTAKSYGPVYLVT